MPAVQCCPSHTLSLAYLTGNRVNLSSQFVACIFGCWRLAHSGQEARSRSAWAALLGWFQWTPVVPYTLSLGANALAKARRVCVRIQWSSFKIGGALMFLVCRKCGPHTVAVLCKPLAAYMNSWSSCRARFSGICLLTCACACCCASTGLVYTEASHSQCNHLVVCVFTGALARTASRSAWCRATCISTF